MTPTSPQQFNIPKLLKPPSAIVYSKDYEPISHIPMNDRMYEYFLEYEIVRFPIHEPVDLKDVMNPTGTPPEPKYAEISAMKVLSTDGIRLILIARNDETGLLMGNTFLPGQTKELNFIKTQAFYRGMVKAMHSKNGKK